MVSRRKKIFYQRLTLLFFILILIYFLVYQSIGLIVHSKKEVIVPNIENKHVIDALHTVSQLGLGLKKIGDTYDPNFPHGTVVLQQPSAGMSVRKGKIIGVIVSLGGEKVFVPNLIGKDKREAEVILRQYNLVLGSSTERYSLKYNKNKVMWQSYPEGSIVDKNTKIDIFISLGLPPNDIILMPDFVNKHISEVKNWVGNNNFKVNLNYKYLEQLKEEGIIIEQKPAPDTLLNPNDEIEFTISKSSNVILKQATNYNFEYELPFIGNVTKNVKIVQMSDEGEYVLYDKLSSSKEKILLYVPERKNSKLRIFIDGILIDEK